MSDLRETVQSGVRWLVSWYKSTTFFALKAFGILISILLLITFITGNVRAARQFGSSTRKEAVAVTSTTVQQVTASIAQTTPPSSTVQASTSIFAPLAVAPNCSGLACQMTRNSGVFGIPLPEDALGTVGPLSISVVSDLASIDAQAKFYTAWLRSSGWRLIRGRSVLDPKRAEAKGLGHVVVLSFCTWTAPPRTMKVTIGYRDSSAKTGVKIDVVVALKRVTCRAD